ASLTFQSGYAVNVGVIGSMLEQGDCVVSDKLNHASIIDGIRLTKADRILYEHTDPDDAERALSEARAKGYRRILLVTDGVFSMDGDIAPLPALVERAEHYGAAVMVDDAHATGVLGTNGRGTTDHFGLHGRVALNIGTLSKAVGVVGGYVASSQVVRDYLIHKARPFLFSSSHPPAVVAACIAAVDVLEQEPQLMEQLWSNTRHFKSGLRELGFDIGESETPITPVMCGEAPVAMQLSDLLLERGVFAQGIGFPTVARGRARVRTIVCATHTHEQLDRALLAFEEVGTRLGLIGDRRQAELDARHTLLRDASPACAAALAMPHRTAAELEEERLEILAAQRDRAAFAPLYERYVDQIHAYVYTLTHDMEQAADVTAAAFAKAMEELPRFEWRGVPYSAWLYRVAGNLVSRERRRPGWIELEPRMLPDAGADPALHAEEHDRADEVRTAVAGLPHDQRQAVLLRFGGDLRNREIAEIMGRSEGAVKLLTFRALTALRRRLGAPMP